MRYDPEKQRRNVQNLMEGTATQEYLNKQRQIEKFKSDRLPSNVRHNHKNPTIPRLNLSVKTSPANFVKEDFIKNLQLASCEVFALILQDLTGKKFIYPNEYEELKPIYDFIKEGGDRISYFRKVRLINEELFDIIENYEIFTMEKFENFEEYSNEIFENKNIPQEEFNEVLKFYNDIAIPKIKSCSNSVEHPVFHKNSIWHEINDYTSYKKLMENLCYIKENYVITSTEKTL